MTVASDLQLVADLISSGKVEAAQRLSQALADLVTERDARQAFEQETNWLLRHARELPCRVDVLETDEGLMVDSATHADTLTAGGACDYVLKDCPRLRALMNGELLGH